MPKSLERKRFNIYALNAFGIPMLMLTAVLCYDRLESDRHASVDGKFGSDNEGDRNGTKTRYDPGFGEESCWFSECSKALSFFLYGLVLFPKHPQTIFLLRFASHSGNRQTDRSFLYP